METDKFEIAIMNVEQKTTVGTIFFKKEAGNGNTFVCIRVRIKNISNEPIGTFSQPYFKLVDGNNTTYNTDIDASSSYVTEVEDTSKFLSDLNPGVTIYDTGVFQIGKDYYAQNSFNLIIKADKKILFKIK